MESNELNNLILEKIEFLKKQKNCKLYTNKFGSRLLNEPNQTNEIININKEYQYRCKKFSKIFQEMDGIQGKINMIQQIKYIFNPDIRDIQSELTFINDYLQKFNVEQITVTELELINNDAIFLRIYAFVKLYYTILKSNDYSKKFNYFYLTDRRHYIDVLKLTTMYRKKIQKNPAFEIPIYLKVAAIFHDIERYSKDTQYESLSFFDKEFLKKFGKKPKPTYDQIRKKVLHPLNTIAIMKTVLFAINPTSRKYYEDIFNIASDIILRHDIPLISETQQEDIFLPDTNNLVYGKSMTQTNQYFNDLKALITADSIALFRNTYPLFILYLNNKKADNKEEMIQTRLKTSLNKVPSKYIKDIQSHIKKGIADFILNSELLSKLGTPENLAIISRHTNKLFNIINEKIQLSVKPKQLSYLPPMAPIASQLILKDHEPIARTAGVAVIKDPNLCKSHCKTLPIKTSKQRWQQQKCYNSCKKKSKECKSRCKSLPIKTSKQRWQQKNCYTNCKKKSRKVKYSKR